MAVERIVVFRPGALGDTLVTVGALAGLRQQFPNAIIELVTNRAGHLLKAAGLVQASSNFGALQVAGLFLSSPVISLRWHNARLIVLWMKRIEYLAPSFTRVGAEMVIAASPEPPASLHIGDHLIQTLAPAGVQPIERWPTLDLAKMRIPQSPLTAGRVVVHPGSGSPKKNWPPELFARLICELKGRGLDPVLLGGPADEAAVSAVKKALGSVPIEVAQAPRVTELAGLLGGAALYVGNDSGVSHLAGLLGTPGVAIFGATDPAVWAPRGERVASIGHAGSWPSFEEVWAACEEVLAVERALGGLPSPEPVGTPVLNA